MNREIKFRAYSDYYKKFEEYSFDQIISGRVNLLFFKESPVVNQSTGLKDKNGKDIYEGDICIICDPYDENKTTFQVEYKNGGFLVEWNNMFCAGEADVTTIGFAMDEEYKLEVIGNSYQNPELLK